MSWGSLSSFPHAILHIDGDSFFASCEVAKNPALRGKPVITGKERGIVSASTYEAKACGVKTGMRISEAKKLCPKAIVLPSDYETYCLFSQRMYDIVRRYTPAVEEYSIDECFADLGGMRRVHHCSYATIAERIKHDLDTELGMTFSIGLSATKVLAKLGSKWKKPSGLTVIPLRDAGVYLAKLPIGSVWGIGPQTAALLTKYGITTALQFAERDEGWVRSMLSKPYLEIWQELNGIKVFPLDIEGRKSFQSISKTKTFTPPSPNVSFVFSQLSKNIENACIKMRRWHLVSARALVFLKTQDFRFHSIEIELSHPTNNPHDILQALGERFSSIFKTGTTYRATGVTFVGLTEVSTEQLDLFGTVQRSETLTRIFESVDALSEKYGKHAIFLGSSFKAMKLGAHVGERGEVSRRATLLFKGETARKRLAIPMLGEVD